MTVSIPVCIELELMFQVLKHFLSRNHTKQFDRWLCDQFWISVTNGTGKFVTFLSLLFSCFLLLCAAPVNSRLKVYNAKTFTLQHCHITVPGLGNILYGLAAWPNNNCLSMHLTFNNYSVHRVELPGAVNYLPIFTYRHLMSSGQWLVWVDGGLKGPHTLCGMASHRDSSTLVTGAEDELLSSTTWYIFQRSKNEYWITFLFCEFPFRHVHVIRSHTSLQKAEMDKYAILCPISEQPVLLMSAMRTCLYGTA